MNETMQLSEQMAERLIKQAFRRIGENCLVLAESSSDLVLTGNRELVGATLELMALVAGYFIDR